MALFSLLIRRPVFKYVPALSLIALLIGFIEACTRSNSGTKSAQSTGQTAASTDTSSESSEIFTIVEEPPSFPGGNPQLDAYYRRFLRYPEVALKNNIQGKVFLSFVVTKTGAIQQIEILRGMGFGTDEEAVRLVKNMPPWKPGRQSGRPVNVKYNLVIPFTIDDQK
ncbi:energy transducer TonB [Spirosoma sp. KNUC1025]|uniref:energy transducer TonB n=1 Tax=Spirosoma sp. KNUC1025 TaxID=2894082 RepID=UPI003865CB0D|nr:energy transducer TonB [Spirosoma sp. KNUC1025]